MNGLIRTIVNAVDPERHGYAKALKPGKEGVGESPRITFKKQIEASFKDTAVRDFVDVLALGVMPGFYTSCATEDEYKGAARAKQIVDDFNETSDMDGLLQVSGREVVATGNSLWQLMTPDKVQRVVHVPIVSFEKVFTNELLEFEDTQLTKKRKIVLGFKQTAEYGGALIPASGLCFFRYNPIDGSGWGSGLMRALMEEYSWDETDLNTNTNVTRTRPSFMEIKAKLDTNLIRIFEKFGGQIEAWIAENKTLAQALQAELKKTPQYGGRLVASGKIDIKIPTFEGRVRFDGLVDYLWNQFLLGGQSPLVKLFTTPGFTEASATVAKDMGDALVKPIQRLVKRNVEALWRKVIVAADKDLDPVKAAVRLNWGSPKVPELKLSDLVALADISAKSGQPFIRPEELRKNLVKFGVELWEPESKGGA